VVQEVLVKLRHELLELTEDKERAILGPVSTGRAETRVILLADEEKTCVEGVLSCDCVADTIDVRLANTVKEAEVYVILSDDRSIERGIRHTLMAGFRSRTSSARETVHLAD
jgi:hypothetical protein